MSDNENKHRGASFDSLWMRRSLGLPIKTVMDASVSSEHVQWFIHRHPYIHIANTGDSQMGLCDVVVGETDTGWVMHDYFDAVAAAPVDFMGDYIPEDLNEAQVGGGKGTLVKQSFDTANALVLMVKNRGWEGIKMISEHELMLWATWVAGQEYGITTVGFEPTEAQKERYRRIQRAKRAAVDEQTENIKKMT